MSISMQVHTHIHCTRVCVRMCVCMCTCVHVRVPVCMCMCVCTYSQCFHQISQHRRWVRKQCGKLHFFIHISFNILPLPRNIQYLHSLCTSYNCNNIIYVHCTLNHCTALCIFTLRVLHFESLHYVFCTLYQYKHCRHHFLQIYSVIFHVTSGLQQALAVLTLVLSFAVTSIQCLCSFFVCDCLSVKKH